MSFYPESGSHVNNKMKVVLDLSNYGKSELSNATGVDTSQLAAEIDFVALKAEVDKVDGNKLVNILSGFNNYETKVDDVDSGKLKIVPLDLKKSVM